MPPKFAPVDAAPLERLEEILKADEVDQIERFLADKNGPRIVQIWSYFATANEHGKHTNATLKLAHLISTWAKLDALKAHIGELIRSDILLPTIFKVIYRALSSMRPSLANPGLKLLILILEYDNGALADEMVRLFDLSLPVLPKLATPFKQELSAGTRLGPRSIRYNFVMFWNSLVSNTSSVVRKDVLESQSCRKILGNLFKYCSKFDTLELISTSIDVWSEKIAFEPLFDRFRGVRLRVFNQWNIAAVVPLFAIPDHDINVKLQKLVSTFLCDSVAVLGEPLPVSVANRTFHLANRFVYNVVTLLKPWEDKLQLETVLAVLQKAPELIPPYNAHLAIENSNFEPRLTFFWIGLALLLQRLLATPLDPALKTKDPEYVIPASLNSASFSACFKHPNSLVRHVGVQLCVGALKKLRSVVSWYESSGNSEIARSLTARCQESFPDVSVMTSVLFSAKNSRLTVAMAECLYLYLDTFPGSQVPVNDLGKLSSFLDDTLSQESPDAGLVAALLRLQEALGDRRQKWHTSRPGRLALFTSLLKLASKTSADEVIRLVTRMASLTAMFPDSKSELVLYSLVAALRAVSEFSDIDSIWKCVDQAVSRIGSPYKYVDLGRLKYQIHPFCVAVFEQFSFVSASRAHLLWISLFSRYLSAVGELIEGLTALVKDYVTKPFGEDITADNSGAASKAFYSLSLEEIVAQFEDIALSDAFETLMTKNLAFFEAALYEGDARRIDAVPQNAFDLCACLRVEGGLLKVRNYLAHSGDDLAFEALEKYMFSVCPPQEFLKIGGFLKQMVLEGVNSPGFWQLVRAYSNHVTTFTSDMASSPAFIWALPASILCSNFESCSKKVADAYLFEIIARKVLVSPSILTRALEIGSSHLVERLVRSELVSIKEEDVPSLVGHLSKSLSMILQSFLETYPQYIQEFASVEGEAALYVIMASNDLKQLDSKVVGTICAGLVKGLPGLTTPDAILRGVRLAAKCGEFCSEEDLETLERFFFEDNVIFSPWAVKFMEFLVSRKKVKSSTLYLGRCTLFINKKFAETSKMTKSFSEFLDALSLFFERFNVKVPQGLITTQLEIVFRGESWINLSSVLEYINNVIAVYSLDSTRLLQLFLSNEKNAIFGPELYEKLLSAVITKRLFRHDPKKSSTILICEKVLLAYGGGLLKSDLILYEILEETESHLGLSWLNGHGKVEIEFERSQRNAADDYDMLNVKFISKEKMGLRVVLKGDQLAHSIENFHETMPIALDCSQGSSILRNLQNSVIDSSAGYKSYDPRFLLLLILNKDGLVSFDENNKPKFDLRSLVDSGLLRYVIVCLSMKNDLVQKLAKTILYNISEFIQAGCSFKDLELVKVMLLKTLATETELCGIIFHLLGEMVSIVATPTHFLYEKTYKYLLGNPTLSLSDLPLFKAICGAPDAVNYGQEIIWFLGALKRGIHTVEDVEFLRKRQIIDWLLTLRGSLFPSFRVQKLVVLVLNRVMDVGGDELLQKRYAMDAELDMTKSFGKGVLKEQSEIDTEILLLKLRTKRGIEGLDDVRKRAKINGSL